MSKAKLRVRLRHAAPEDSRHVFRWRNNAQTRRYYRNPHRVSWREHEAWFHKKLGSEGSRLYIIEASGRPLGQVRMDGLPQAKAEVSISVDVKARRKGIAIKALQMAERKIHRDLKVRRLVAHVRSDNRSSASLFIKAGYVFKTVQHSGRKSFYRMEHAL